MQRANPLENTLMLEKFRAGREGGNRGWDGWWLVDWQWWQSIGFQRVKHDLATKPQVSLWLGPKLQKQYLTCISSVQFSSVAQSCLTLCNPMNCSTLGLPVHHQLPEFTQTHIHRVGDAIQPSHPLLSPSPPAPKTSQHQGLFQRVNSSREVAKILEFQLQHQSFQWTALCKLHHHS